MTSISTTHLLFAAPIVLGALLLFVALILRQRTGLRSDATVLASDTSQNRVENIRDRRSMLVGQPDYLVEERVWGRKRVVPIELKPLRKSAKLYDSDRLQLACYMILTRAKYGRRFAGYGRVRYKEHSFQVRLTRALESECLAMADNVEWAAARPSDAVGRSHNQAGRCRACALRRDCGDRLSG